MTESSMPGRYGEIYDRGYQHYLGKRLGRRHAIWALIVYSIKRALGIKKSWTAKVIPIIIYLATAGVVVVVIGIEAFLKSAGTIAMSYHDYFTFIFLLEGAFVATVAPEMVCGDRRENVLSLYFSRAISRFDYVLSKLGAVAILTMTISVIPAIFLWLFRQLLSDRPLSALVKNVDDLARVLLVGTVIAFYLGSLGLLISSFNRRNSIATAVIFVTYTMLQAFTLLLLSAVSGETARNYLALISPLNLIREFAMKLFGTYNPGEFKHDGFAWPVYFSTALAVVVVSTLITIWRYVPED